MLRVITCNVNGIRASHRKGFFDWLHGVSADIVCVQETKAHMVGELKASFEMQGYQSFFASAEKKGYSGVGIYCKTSPLAVSTALGEAQADQEGRYVCASFANAHVVSLYLPSGTSGDARQYYKMQLLDYYYQARLAEDVRDATPWIICGDFNIAHKAIDLKNWKQNQKNSGFLPEERAWMDKVLHKTGWVDAFRAVNSEPDQYTWWSYRQGARARNVGWRIDYQLVSPMLAPSIRQAYVATDVVVSDHAPLVVDYDYSLS